MFYRLLYEYLTYPSSAAIARQYADNVDKPMKSIFNPIRQFAYVFMLFGTIRLLLNYFLQETYSRFDLSVAIFTILATHRMASLAVILPIMVAFVFDYTITVRPHWKVAPMLEDLLINNQSKSIIFYMHYFQIFIYLQYQLYKYQEMVFFFQFQKPLNTLGR